LNGLCGYLFLLWLSKLFKERVLEAIINGHPEVRVENKDFVK